MRCYGNRGLSRTAVLLIFILIPVTGLAEGNLWLEESDALYVHNYAAAVCGAGDLVFLATSNMYGGSMHFMSYNAGTGEWLDLSVPPEKFKNGTCLAWDGGNSVYAMIGSAYSETTRNFFYRYDISEDTWVELAPTPSPGGQGAGDAITMVPGEVLDNWVDKYFYAIIGARSPYGHGTKLARYSALSDTWTTLAEPPTRTDDGCSIVWAGGDDLYALPGEYDEHEPHYDFFRYDIHEDAWFEAAPIPSEPDGVGDGGSLIYLGGSKADTIYALSGGAVYPEEPGDRFFGYSLSDSAWTELQELPEPIGDQNGPRLAFANGHIFCWKGCYGDPVLWRGEFETFIHPRVEPEKDIYTPGETAAFTAFLSNEGYAEEPITVDAVLNVRLPWGPIFPITAVSGIDLGPDTHLFANMQQMIPGSAQPGIYTLVLRILEPGGGGQIAVAEHSVKIE